KFIDLRNTQIGKAERDQDNDADGGYEDEAPDIGFNAAAFIIHGVWPYFLYLDAQIQRSFTGGCSQGE
ncbi:MAG TPA: hypothetical protein VLC79_07665, partial [Cellvibrio sp.]|nr:hypothetical protein [Cellvibrio sp.]